MKLRLIIGEGHWLARYGLTVLMREQADLEVAGEADSREGLVRLAAEMQADIVLLDLKLPGGGLPALESIKLIQRSLRVLVMGEVGACDEVRAALHAGCDGYVRKDRSKQELLDAVHRVAEGQTYIEAGLARELVLEDPRRRGQVTGVALQRLTDRELTVFRLIGAGYTNRAAAQSINLSPKTVEKHRAAVMQKLQLHSALQLRLMAAELGVTLGPTMADQPGNRAGL
jgi:DNA-binding NarL/FixJ family response regulator